MSARAWAKGERLGFMCPGCGSAHYVGVGPEGWKWNGSLERPTLSPSVLVSGYISDREVRCHSFIENGKIHFLNDCLHSLAGKTVDLPEDA